MPASSADTAEEPGASTAVAPEPSAVGGAAADGASGDAGPTPVKRRRAWPLWGPLVLLAAVALFAAGFGLRGLTDRAPGTGSVDAGFLRDMSEHHAQAVQMSMLEFSHGADSQTVAVAQDIALSQQRDIGVMHSWLSDWGLEQSTVGEPMRWMGGADGQDSGGQNSGHGGHDMGGTTGGTPVGTDGVRMPGMASTTELAQLASASGRDSDVLFLTLMIRHHRGGIAMAQYATRHAGEDQVRTLAKAMVVVQSREIEQMQADLTRLGAPRA
ncbi:DUF305 domain-containing protein [Frankia sp. CNm7]|uniref:DUF305 domain-containing protein n=2 Tax=Frankia nepalensis TaxID=1836974 RepID=A0A937RJN2_9ACTN|nr:DUF305 domain-containing protein [Frankia nepalensis]MBL7515702.1 DUF305 domain-containing protein [Frankia nepalensis]MBL7517606.1 DUF305 domain-containing protein [Frankia nepalensis]MBL7633483.1 DUF305 domain-containing protein [Frankia nepalensis]